MNRYISLMLTSIAFAGLGLQTSAVVAQETPASTPPANGIGFGVVGVLLPECATVPYDAFELTESLRVELSGMGVGKVVLGGGSSAQSRVIISVPVCDADSETVKIRLEDQPSETAVERSFALHDVPPSLRSRAIALAVAEMFHAARSHHPDSFSLRAIGLGKAPSDQPTSTPVPTPVKTPKPWTSFWGGVAEARDFGGQGGPLLGARFVGEIPLHSWEDSGWWLGMGVGGDTGTTEDRLGEVSLRLATATLDIAHSIGTPVFFWRLGPRIEGGVLFLEGTPKSVEIRGQSFTRPFFASTLSAGFRVRSSGLVMLGDLELGVVLSGVRAEADGVTLARLSNRTLGVRLGVAGDLF